MQTTIRAFAIGLAFAVLSSAVLAQDYEAQAQAGLHRIEAIKALAEREHRAAERALLEVEGEDEATYLAAWEVERKAAERVGIIDRAIRRAKDNVILAGSPHSESAKNAVEDTARVHAELLAELEKQE